MGIKKQGMRNLKFIIATKNKKKLKELSRILEPLGIEAVTEFDLGITLPEVEETGNTFEENAYLKAKSALDTSGLPAVADDSGLCVDALDGAPGVYSARYAGEDAPDEMRIIKLLENLKDVPTEKRTARFVSSICCVFPDGRKFTVRGTCEGTIDYSPKGDNGFGYDPVFLCGDKTFAEMSDAEKDAVSHRGNSLKLFAKELPKYL